jgi:hypothetical protein
MMSGGKTIDEQIENEVHNRPDSAPARLDRAWNEMLREREGHLTALLQIIDRIKWPDDPPEMKLREIYDIAAGALRETGFEPPDDSPYDEG